MSIEEMLVTRRNEINAEIARLQEERAKIDNIAAQLTEPAQSIVPEDPKIARERAIIEAVRNGNTRPKSIDRYLRSQLKMRLNIGSLRSTLSRLKSEQKINHNETGWVA